MIELLDWNGNAGIQGHEIRLILKGMLIVTVLFITFWKISRKSQ